MGAPCTVAGLCDTSRIVRFVPKRGTERKNYRLPRFDRAMVIGSFLQTVSRGLSGVREALTVIGFLLILALAAIFAAPLYVDWNDWRATIARALSEHLGTAGDDRGPDRGAAPAAALAVDQRRLGRRSRADRRGSTVVAVSGDVSLDQPDARRCRAFEPRPVLAAADRQDRRRTERSPLCRAGRPGARGDDRQLRDPGRQPCATSMRDTAQDLRLEGVHLVGEARSLLGPVQGRGRAGGRRRAPYRQDHHRRHRSRPA